MSPFRAALHAEWTRTRRDPAILLLLLGWLLIIGIAAHGGSSWALKRSGGLEAVAERAQVERAERRQQLVDAAARNEKAPRAASLPYAQVDMVILPTAPSAALSVGQADNHPAVARVTAITDTHGIFDAFGSPTENPDARAAGAFDPAFAIVFLLPLLLLAGAFDLWTGERERGLAPLLASQPVRASTILLAKLVVKAVTLLLPLTAITIATVAFAAPDAGAAVLGWLAAIVGAYGLFWLSVAAIANQLTRRPAAAAIGCGAVWLVFVFIGPATMNLVLDAARPAPSRAALATEIRTALVEAQARGSDVLDSYMNQHPTAVAELENLSEGARQAYAVQLAADIAVAPIVARSREAAGARKRLADRLRLLSPATATQDSLDRLAGTDADRALAFVAQSNAHLHAVRAFVAPRLLDDRLLSVADYVLLPRFQFQEPSTVARDSALLVNLAVNLIPALLLLLLATTRPLKTD